jgi:hypothetical protein
MKKILSLFSSFLFPKFVFAQTTIAFRNPLQTSSFWVLVDNILNIIFTITLPIVVVLIIAGAILITTAAGNERQINIGKNCIVYSLIGLILVIMSKGILGLIFYLSR